MLPRPIGSSQASVSASGTLVTAGTNTNGILITSVCMHGNGSTVATDISGVLVDGTRVITLLGASPAVNVATPLLVPPGVALTYALANGVSLDISYEVM